jgi:hypothetical protein
MLRYGKLGHGRLECDMSRKGRVGPASLVFLDVAFVPSGLLMKKWSLRSDLELVAVEAEAVLESESESEGV